MGIKLNVWQTICLFVPLGIGSLLMNVTYNNLDIYQRYFSIFNILMHVTLTIIILYQTQLVLGFNKMSGIMSTPFNYNALVPAIFIVGYCCYVILLTFNPIARHQIDVTPGPIKIARYHASTVLIIALLFHALVTFFIINPLFLSQKIKNISSDVLRTNLLVEYNAPAKRLIKVSLYFLGFLLLESILHDVLLFS